MSGIPFVLADHDRVEQFAVVARSRGLLREFELWIDPQGVAWARRRAGGHCFAVSLLGPGRVFDPYAREQRAEDLARRRQAMDGANPEEQRRELQRIVLDLRLGSIAERVVWVIHRRVMQAKRSLVRIPDRLAARSVWGPDHSAWPHHWRRSLRTAFRSLAWLHVAAWPEDGPPPLGQHSVLLTHAADLRGSRNDTCDDDCPSRDGPPHNHFLANIGRGFLGILERFSRDDGSGVRTYNFKIRGRKREGPTLREAGKSGKLVTIYLPAKLGDPAACSRFTPNQHRLLRAIVRETTRRTKTERRDLSEAEVFPGNEIPGIQRKKTIVSDLLEPDGRYVGFNGNGKRKRLGYGLTTSGGWLVKAGNARSDTARFIADLGVLADRLGLIPVGIHVPTKECFDLKQLQALAGTPSGRATLAKTHLRVYTGADYVNRWNDLFRWAAIVPAVEGGRANPTVPLASEMKRKGITQRALVRGIEADPSFVNKIFGGKKRWPQQRLKRAQAWVAARDEPGETESKAGREDDAERPTVPQPRSAPPLLPLLTATVRGKGSMLNVAIAYRRRGWSVVPQDPGAKQPCVRWKPFQERLPTEDELAGWFAQWPEAGLAVVLGPVSRLLVIDVDGTEGHEVLLERLGSEPAAPKALSGSRQPHRYHLFFRCPEMATKAKATPWHPKLEFRGKGGIVVIPPSLHSSGHRYAWARGRSPDDLSLPELPPEIVAALQPSRPTPPAIPPAGDVTVEDARPSTREFLAGKCANGPKWNERLFRAACDLAGRGMSRDEAKPLLLAGARPWDEANAEIARGTIDSAFSEPRKPARY